jgi:hypothetical protein
VQLELLLFGIELESVMSILTGFINLGGTFEKCLCVKLKSSSDFEEGLSFDENAPVVRSKGTYIVMRPMF